MKRGKEFRSANGQAIQPRSANEIMALMFVMVEQAPGAFSLRFVSNDELIEDLRSHNMLESFLDDVDRLDPKKPTDSARSSWGLELRKQ